MRKTSGARRRRSKLEEALAREPALLPWLTEVWMALTVGDPDAVLSPQELNDGLAGIEQWLGSNIGVPADQLSRASDTLLEAMALVGEHGFVYGAASAEESSDEAKALGAAYRLLHAVHARIQTATLLRDYRAGTGASLRDMAPMVGLSHTLLAQIERCAVRLPSAEVLPPLVALLKEWSESGTPVKALPHWERTYGSDVLARQQIMKTLRRALGEAPDEMLPTLSAVLVQVIALLSDTVRQYTETPSPWEER
jgi:hypothetical protein